MEITSNLTTTTTTTTTTNTNNQRNHNHHHHKSNSNSIISISNGKNEKPSINKQQINSTLFFNNPNYFNTNTNATTTNTNTINSSNNVTSDTNTNNVNNNANNHSTNNQNQNKIGLNNNAGIHKKERHEHSKPKRNPPIGSRGLETDQHRIAQRQKQIDYGKNTLGYQEYCKAVPREKRKPGTDPQTPDIHLKISKRGFDGLVKIWRRGLHEFDPTKKDDEIEIDLDDIEADQDFLAGKSMENVNLGQYGKEEQEEREERDEEDVHFKRKAVEKFEESFV